MVRWVVEAAGGGGGEGRWWAYWCTLLLWHKHGGWLRNDEGGGMGHWQRSWWCSIEVMAGEDSPGNSSSCLILAACCRILSASRSQGKCAAYQLDV